MIDRQQVMDALAEVHDPELHKSIVELNMVRDVQIDGRNVKVTVALHDGRLSPEGYNSPVRRGAARPDPRCRTRRGRTGRDDAGRACRHVRREV